MKPILFNTEMVRAILDGRKTVTRRPCKGIPDGTHHAERNKDGSFGFMYGGYSNGAIYDGWKNVAPPYSIGDILYVRETFKWYQKVTGKGILRKIEQFIGYKADSYNADNPSEFFEGKWHPSIHMPKDIARIFLRVTGVRVERLMDITEAGARAEGFSVIDGFQPATKTFFDTWRAIYGDEVSWVWVIEFERCEKEED